MSVKTIKKKKNHKPQLHSYRKLGFTKLETASIVKNLNLLLSSYVVHYQKLRNFHWNVTGPEFFELHEKFEELYMMTHNHIDEIAERIRVFGQRPVSTLKEMLEMSDIKEPEKDLSSMQMVKSVLDDLQEILTKLTEVLDQAIESGDTGTELMINNYIKKTEKHHWMLTAYIRA